MIPRCQYFRQPSVIDSVTGTIWHGVAWCDLSDNACMIEYGQPADCEEYLDILMEVDNESSFGHTF